MIDSLLSISGAKVVGSPGERKSAIETMMSMVQFFGSPSIFFTFAPDDIHSILTFKMSNNRSECINRDYNATLNMKKITRYLLKHKIRPESYRRTSKPF